MKYYFAPMEGITLYPLRNVHNSMFEGTIDKYYTPFLTAHHNFHFKKREKRDVAPELIKGFDNWQEEIVPQIMANRVDTFVWAAKEMASLGYREVNLNLGCPATTVTNSHKGSGLLQDTEYLDRLLDGIFQEAGKDSLSFPAISIKTRLGFSDEKELEELMKIYARYPICELTIHARVREDFYKGLPRIDAFKKAVEEYKRNNGKADICYNGDVVSSEFTKSLSSQITDNTDNAEHSYYSALMIGRGLLTDPALVRQLKGGENLKSKELKDYLDKLYEGYAEYIPEDCNVIFKMLEHWAFLYVHFRDCDKYLKAIRKSRSKGEYHAAVNNIFASCEFV